MEQEIDLAPRHLVDWLRDDLAAGGARPLTVRATREFLAEPAASPGDGIDADDEMASLTTVGLLEVAPAAGHGAWVLRCRIETAFGDHLPDEGSVPDDPEPISLDAFADCFLADDAPDALVTLEAESAADRRKFERIFARILTDRHARR